MKGKQKPLGRRSHAGGPCHRRERKKTPVILFNLLRHEGKGEKDVQLEKKATGARNKPSKRFSLAASRKARGGNSWPEKRNISTANPGGRVA